MDDFKRFDVVVEEGIPQGDLYGLEQTNYHRVIDLKTGKVIATFEEEIEAYLSFAAPGTWELNGMYGVSSVMISQDQQSIEVRYHYGNRERIPLDGLE